MRREKLETTNCSRGLERSSHPTFLQKAGPKKGFVAVRPKTSAGHVTSEMHLEPTMCEVKQDAVSTNQPSGSNVIRVVSVGRGAVAMAPLPGRNGDLGEDLIQIAVMRPAWVITLVTQMEMDAAGLADLGTAFQDRGARWLHMPIADYGTPDIDGEKLWSQYVESFKSILAGQGRIVVHCHGGCGRAGMIALRLMIESGEDPKGALKRLRQVHPQAVETDAQYEWAARGWRPSHISRHAT